MAEFVITVVIVSAFVWAWQAAEARGWVLRVPFLSRALDVIGPYVFGLWAGWWSAVITLVLLVTAEFGDTLAMGGALLAGLAAFLIARKLATDAEPDSSYDDERHAEAWRLLNAQEYEAAARLYRELAEPGDMVAMINLANILCDSLGEPEEAVRWYQRAIDLGSTAAAENLGMLYLDEGRTEDAREMFELARTRGGTTRYLGAGGGRV